MHAALIMTVAILLQFTAALLAFRLALRTSRRLAPLMVAGALLLMALRRAFCLYRLAVPDSQLPGVLIDAYWALAISALLLVAVWGISFLPEIEHETQNLRRSKDELESVVAARTGELLAANEALEVELEERLKAEASLQVEHRKLFSLLENLPAAVGAIAPDYSIRFANRRYREAFANIDGKRCYEVLGFDQPCEICRNGLILESGEHRNFEWTSPEGDRTFQIYHYPFADVDGSPLVLTLIIDITKRKQAEEALKASEAKYRTLVENISLGITWIGPDYRIIMTNAGHAEMFGKPASEFIGKECFREFEKRDTICPHCPGRLAMATGQPAEAETEGIRDDGSHVTVHLHVFPTFDATGAATGFIEIVEDITERKQTEKALQESEEKYRLLVNQIPAVVFKGYADWSIDFFDDKIEALTGYPKEEFNSRRLKWSDLIVPEDLDYANQVFKQALRTIRSYVREYRIRTRNGDILWIQCRGQIFLDDQGKIDYISGVLFDITQQKLAEKKLRRSEARLAQAQRIARMGYWEWDLKTDALSWSDEVYRIYNQDPQKFVLSLETFYNCLHPEDRGYVKKELAEFISGSSKPYSVENRIVRPGGEVRLIHSEAELSYDEAGKPTRALGTVRDITEERQAEEALKASEAKYRNLVEQIPAITYMLALDEHGTPLFVSPQIEAILGFPPEDFLADPHLAIDLMHPDDRERVVDEMRHSYAMGEPFESEYRMVSKSGAVVWLHQKNRIVHSPEGQPLFLQGIMMDITERKRAEEALRESEKRFRDITENAAEWVWEVDAQGKYTYASPVVEKLLGYKPEEVLGKPFYDFFHPEDREELKKAALEKFTARQPFRDFLNRNLHKNGESVWFLAAGVPFLDDKENFKGYRGSSFDITIRKRSEAALQESEKNLHYLASRLLTAQENERRRISRELHDELGQSLLVLKLQMRHVQDIWTRNPQETRAVLEHARTYLDKVVDNLRRLSRDLSPHVLEDLGLSAALKHLLCEFCKYYDFQQCSVHIDEIDDLFSQEAQINIYRIFQECLTNIGKYAQASLVKVNIQKQDGKVGFSVEDDGIGFDVAQLAACNVTEKGLGLAAMEERVRMLGGSLNLWSLEGAGTRIAFTLPLKRN